MVTVIQLAHVRIGGIDCAIFNADARLPALRDVALAQLTDKARSDGLLVAKAALAFRQAGVPTFYGDPELVQYLCSPYRDPISCNRNITLRRAEAAAGSSSRRVGTTSHGGSFGGFSKRTAWLKATVEPGLDPGAARRDRLGNLILWSDYGDVKSRYGWEIDHIKPVSKGGTDDPSNLQALQWRANRVKGDTWPWP